MRVKEQQRTPEPSAGSSTHNRSKDADTVSKTTHGYDAGKKINGRKRSQ
jgi:hypothetical protein